MANKKAKPKRKYTKRPKALVLRDPEFIPPGAERERGRPTAYTPELAALICVEIATTSDGLDKICDRNPDFPSARTVHRWVVDHEGFRQSYVRAKRDQVWRLAEEIIPIADTPQIGEIVTIKTDGVEVRRVDMIEHRKLRIDARKWIMAHLEPKKWGQRAGEASEGDSDPLKDLIGEFRARDKKINDET